VLFPSATAPAPAARVVVTGAGIVTPLGQGWAANASGFEAGRSGLRPVTRFDVTRHRARIAGEVDLPSHPGVGPMALRHKRRWDPALGMLWWATREALHQTQWSTGEPQPPLVLGTTSAGTAHGELFYEEVVNGRATCRHQPTRALYYQAQRQALEVSANLGLNGPVTIISNACASGANAIGHAWTLIRTGHTARALAGGYEGLCRLVFSGFDSLQALSPGGCRPFDASRDGLTLGEGAAVLALETLESAVTRQATILGELTGYGASTDLHHLTQPHPEGHAARRAMEAACETAGTRPDQIDYLNAHGTGTLLNDSSETAAINAWAAGAAPRLPVSSTKRTTGHLLGAAGAVEAVLCLMVLQGQWLPPMPELETPDPLCQFPLVRKPTRCRVEQVMSNSFGFGGANASLLFRKWP
jgi:3-oxoacyl-[acyl-carrier-protein] synthase II